MKSPFDGRLESSDCEVEICGLFLRMRDRRCVSSGTSSGFADKSWRKGLGVGGICMSDLLILWQCQAQARSDRCAMILYINGCLMRIDQNSEWLSGCIKYI